MSSETAPILLKDLIHVNPRVPLTKTKSYPFIDMAAIQEWQRDIPLAAVSTREFRGNGSKFEGGDILLARITPCFENGKTAVAPKLHEPAHGSTEFIVVRPKRDADHAFIYGLLRSPDFRDYAIKQMVGTSGRQRIPHQALESYAAELPTAEYRESASRLLGAIEALCTDLRHQNTALESISQTLFRSWFVNFDPVHAKAAGNAPEAMSAELAALFPSEFVDSELGPIPKGWFIGQIGDIGHNPRVQGKPTEIPSTTPYVGLEHMPRRSLSLTEWGSAATVESGKFWFTPSDILFGKLRPYFHKVGIANVKGVCSTDILVIRPKEPNWHAFLVMHLFSKAFIEHATQLSDGARMPRTNWRDTAAYKFALPPVGLAKRFNQIVQPMFALMKADVESIRSLASLRDHLLPRLITGKLRLEDAEAAVEAITSGLEAEPA